MSVVPEVAPRRRVDATSWTTRAARFCVAILMVGAHAPAMAEEPTAPALEALVREAVGRHPEVRRALEAAAAAQEIPSRVGSLPDPVIGLQAQNVRIDEPALDTSPMAAVQIGITEAVPFPGKLSRRRAVAQGRAVALSREVVASRARIAFGVRSTYWRLHFAERALEVTADSERVLDALARAVIARLAVGKAPQQDALQASVTQSRVRSLLQERREALVSARRALAASIGREPTGDFAATVAPPTAALSLDRAGLVARARAENPTLSVARARVAAAERAVEESQYDRWPDLQLGAGYRVRAVVPGDPSRGADMFGATLGVTLPVFMGSKQNARVREARREAAAAREALADRELEVVTRLERALDAVERLGEELALYERELLPEAEKALDASIADYQVGVVGFVSVLMNWQTRLDARLAHERLVADRAERLAEVRSLTREEEGT